MLWNDLFQPIFGDMLWNDLFQPIFDGFTSEQVFWHQNP